MRLYKWLRKAGEYLQGKPEADKRFKNYSMILQLNPTIPILTPKGSGEALGWLDYSSEHDLMWITALDSNGEVWIFPNKDIRLHPNYSVGRKYTPNTSGGNVNASTSFVYWSSTGSSPQSD